MPNHAHHGPDRSPALNAIPFEELPRAEANLRAIGERVSKATAKALPALLNEVPDPGSALNYFERLTAEAGPELLRLIDKHPSLAHYALAVFSYSPFLGETLLRNTDLFDMLSREENLGRSYSKEEFQEALARFRARSLEQDVAKLLACFKRREYIRIMLRDVLGLARVAEATEEISCLSDVLVEEALKECDRSLRTRYGTPQYKNGQGRIVEAKSSVLALGKLGGNELNYSSDVDLLFLYDAGPADEQAGLSTREYFVRLAQNATDVLSRVTPEGFVFRIDLRLRPRGSEGEAAISLERALRYYREAAQDWESQALIKVRHCAGDVPLARRFIRAIEPNVYTGHLNFAAIETAVNSRDQVSDKRRTVLARESGPDVKLDRGGIREIEFLVQCLQRVYGGKEPWLRSRGTLFALQQLHDKEHISGSDFQTLTSTYEFLRNVEHRLQLRRGQQTHRVPSQENERRILARALKLEPTHLIGTIRDRMQNGAEIYDRIIHHQHQQTTEEAEEAFALRTLDVSFGRVHSDHQILVRLAAENPELRAIASRTDLEPHTRRNLFRFLGSALTGPERYAAVASAPEMLEKAVDIFGTSEYLTDMLVRHPEDIGSLCCLRASTPRHQALLFSQEHPVQSGASPALLEYMARPDIPKPEKLSLMRQRYRHQMFLSGARDVIEARPVAASFADTSAAAEEAVGVALSVVGNPGGFAILALGRLGTNEFDCLSDADLLFVRSETASATAATRAAEAVMQALSSYTSDGTVMPVDLRLRPHGGEGEMTITPEVLSKYAETEAQPWEALTYTKLRYLAGDRKLSASAIQAATIAWRRFAASAEFLSGVREMRRKLEMSDRDPNFRTAPGGTYDIDFLVAYLIVEQGIHTSTGNTRERLQQLGKAGFIKRSDLQVSLDATELFRTAEHAVRLVTGRPGNGLPISETARRSVEELTARILGEDHTRSLEDELAETAKKVRDVYERTIA